MIIIKARIIKHINELTLEYNNRLNSELYGLEDVRDEIVQLRADLELIEDIEERAFKYALIQVSGESEKIAGIHWGLYKARRPNGDS